MNSGLEKYDSVKRWFTYISSEKTTSQSTRQLYIWALERWCKFLAKTPDEIIAERTAMIHDPRLGEAEKHGHEELLRQSFNRMEQEEGKARSTCGAYWAAVKSFYRANWVPLLAKSPSIWPAKMYKVPNKEEMLRIWEACDPRVKLWLLCQKDSGISESDLIDVNRESPSTVYGTVGDQLKSGQVPIHITVMRGKVKQAGHYDTYFGEESYDALQGVSGERFFDLAVRTVRAYLPRYARKAGIKGPRVTPHCIRKYFNTRMKLGNVNEAIVEYMMGHKLGRVKSAYLVPPPEELGKLYQEAYPNISIF